MWKKIVCTALITGSITLFAAEDRDDMGQNPLAPDVRIEILRIDHRDEWILANIIGYGALAAQYQLILPQPFGSLLVVAYGLGAGTTLCLRALDYFRESAWDWTLHHPLARDGALIMTAAVCCYGVGLTRSC
ncbi:MAG: hypothetical protein LBJ92_03255 [Holosporales bacterium]|jgi:hypothetical protein|nr:hypothetical protein [Holosporales bacterium]